MPITPDTKDWTWVTQRPCPQCGYDAAQVPVASLPGLLTDNAQRWLVVLRRDDVARRPDDSTWSPLEYAAHVRDVHLLFAGRLRAILTQDNPALASWDQDAAAEEQQYGQQDPAAVGEQLVNAAQAAAVAFAAVDPAQYQRTGTRSDGAVFTVATMAQYYGHEPVHHLWDVTG